MPRCSVCDVPVSAQPEDECDGQMDTCKRACARLHMDEVKDGLTFCTSCFVWALGTYNDILAGRSFDAQAVPFLRLMVLDQEPLLTERVRRTRTRGRAVAR